MKLVDRICACILILGGLLHAVGSYLGYKNQPITLFWALNASTLALLIGAINLLRVVRPGDRPLAWICFASSLAWAIGAFILGVLLGNIFDPRPLTHAVMSLALAGFSLRAALGGSTARAE